MCLIKDDKETIKFIKENSKKKYVTVYKILTYNRATKKLKTPYQNVSVNPGYLVAEGTLEFYESDSIYEGAIHCFIEKESCNCYVEKASNRVLLKCRANMSDFIAVGYDGDICFSKIYISEAEYKRALKEVRRTIKNYLAREKYKRKRIAKCV